VAKAKASDVALQATAAMIQYHGGIGYTWEHEAHFFYKRAKRLAAQWGDADAHREKIADLTLPA
jgi:alkylation response protein AidB-like acyl-CoA dehydrogenase